MSTALPDRMPPIPRERMNEAQRAAADELIAGPRKGVKGPFIPLLRSPELSRSAIFVVTDETSGLAQAEPVPALALGALVQSGSHYWAKTSHYGLLRTLEDAWGLPRLGASARAAPISGIWR